MERIALIHHLVGLMKQAAQELVLRKLAKDRRPDQYRLNDWVLYGDE
jgi:hypothetical protein